MDVGEEQRINHDSSPKWFVLNGLVVDDEHGDVWEWEYKGEGSSGSGNSTDT